MKRISEKSVKCKKDKMTISRRSFIKNMTLAATGVALAKNHVPLLAQKNSKKMNILYIMTDQQPISCFGAYGTNPVIRTPYLDALSRQGCLFERAYVTGFPCCPSRASQLTGRYVHNHRVIVNEVMLDSRIPCLGDICKKTGYSTGYFGKWHLGGWIMKGANWVGGKSGHIDWKWELDETDNGWVTRRVENAPGEDYPQHGFDTWAGGWKQYREWLREKGLDEIVDNHPGLGCHMILPPSDNYEVVGASEMDQAYHVEAFIAEKTEKFISEHAGSPKPWCAVASFYGPHPPVTPSKPWDELYTMDEAQLPENHRDSMSGKPESQKVPSRYKLGSWSDDQFKDYIRKYWGFTTYIDLQIGRILNALKKTDQMDNTVIVFTSDHGNMCGNHGMIHKTLGNGYEELFRVPMVIYIPGCQTIPKTDALISHVDILPTILEACNIPCSEEIDGKSVMPVIKGEKTEHRDTIFADAADTSLICRNDRYKFVLHWKNWLGSDKPKEMDELYDLRQDPLEMTNLIHAESGKITADKMRDELYAWLKQTNHRYADSIKKMATA